jgi:hypothetical protein
MAKIQIRDREQARPHPGRVARKRDKSLAPMRASEGTY